MSAMAVHVKLRALIRGALSMKKCKLDYCDRKHSAKGYCNMHHKRWKRHGDPDISHAGNPSHGMSHTAVYNSWVNMRQRCMNPKSPAYNRYGGRGVAVCEDWQVFETFLSDMGYPPTSSHSVERIDNNAGYRKDNCKWATAAEQSRNRRNNRIIEHNGLSMCVTDWSRKIGIKPRTLHARLYTLGWSIEKAFNTPGG